MEQENSINIIDLSEYDSAKFISIMKSLQHSTTNILARQNRVKFHKNDKNIIFPLDFVKDSVLPHLKPYIETEPLPAKYHMNPQFYCLDKYRCVDLWDIILSVNGCMSSEDFNMPTVKFLNYEGIQELFIFIQKVSNKF